MDAERKAMLGGIRMGDMLKVKHGRGTIRALVCVCSPFLVVKKITSKGYHMNPAMLSVFDVIEIIDKEGS